MLSSSINPIVSTQVQSSLVCLTLADVAAADDGRLTEPFVRFVGGASDVRVLSLIASHEIVAAQSDASCCAPCTSCTLRRLFTVCAARDILCYAQIASTGNISPESVLLFADGSLRLLRVDEALLVGDESDDERAPMTSRVPVRADALDALDAYAAPETTSGFISQRVCFRCICRVLSFFCFLKKPTRCRLTFGPSARRCLR